jgi:hypothetical protein
MGTFHVERNDHLDGQSKSAARKADALRRIAFDRRNSPGCFFDAAMTLIPSSIETMDWTRHGTLDHRSRPDKTASYGVIRAVTSAGVRAWS